eukprot:SAG11_NODE_421_length_9620_cov_10.014809_4_plen_50_part_00
MKSGELALFCSRHEPPKFKSRTLRAGEDGDVPYSVDDIAGDDHVHGDVT